MYFSTPQWDLNLLFLINQQGHSEILNPVMLLVSDSLFLSAFGLVASIIAMWRYKVSLTVVLGLGLTLIASSQICDFAKKETNRVRPYHSIGGTWFHIHFRRQSHEFIQMLRGYGQGHALLSLGNQNFSGSQVVVLEGRPGQIHVGRQIGRASCRERV